MAKRTFCIIVLALLLVGCWGEKGRIIPRSTMQNIYADLFLADEWLSTHGEYSNRADSTLFYEPIFKKYGYTTKDFRKSVNYYLKDPTRYGRMISRTYKLLSSREKIISKLLDSEQQTDRVLMRLSDAAPQFPLFPMTPEVPIEIDSVLYSRDTAVWYLPEYVSKVEILENIN